MKLFQLGHLPSFFMVQFLYRFGCKATLGARQLLEFSQDP